MPSMGWSDKLQANLTVSYLSLTEMKLLGHQADVHIPAFKLQEREQDLGTVGTSKFPLSQTNFGVCCKS